MSQPDDPYRHGPVFWEKVLSGANLTPVIHR